MSVSKKYDGTSKNVTHTNARYVVCNLLSTYYENNQKILKFSITDGVVALCHQRTTEVPTRWTRFLKP